MLKKTYSSPHKFHHVSYTLSKDFLRVLGKIGLQLNQKKKITMPSSNMHLKQWLDHDHEKIDSKLSDKPTEQFDPDILDYYNSDDEKDEPEIEPLKAMSTERLLWCAAKNLFTEFQELFNHFRSTILEQTDEDSYNCLHKAVSNGHFQIVEYILANLENEEILKQILNSKTSQDWTPLHCACHWNHTDIARLLARHPLIEINSLSKGNLTAAHIACNIRNPRDTLVELLTNHIDADKQYQKERIDLTIFSTSDQQAFHHANRQNPYPELLEIGEEYLNSSHLLSD